MKKNYLLGLIVLGLISLSVYSTYAMFTASVETNDIVSLSASTLPTESEIVEYERLTIKSKEKKVIEYTVNNNTNNSLYYGVWYEMVNPTSINDDIVIGKSEDTTSNTLGQLTRGSNAKVLFVIENKTVSNIVINVGVGYSETSSLNLPTNRNLITEEYVDILPASEYIESLLPSNQSTMNNDDPDNNVRYMGADPNNYVSFNNELWRIIGVFDVASTFGGPTEKRIKIIRNEYIGSMKWNGKENTNNWENSSLKEYLNENYFNSLTSEYKEQVGDTLWNLGGSITDNDVVANVFYARERGTQVYAGRPTEWIGKIGLMYPSDYGYATSGGITTNRNFCLSINLRDWSDYDDCLQQNYIYNNLGGVTWTITTNSSDMLAVFVISPDGTVFTNDANFPFGNGVFPTLYLKSNVIINGGDGTSSNPYTLSL